MIRSLRPQERTEEHSTQERRTRRVAEHQGVLKLLSSLPPKRSHSSPRGVEMDSEDGSSVEGVSFPPLKLT